MYGESIATSVVTSVRPEFFLCSECMVIWIEICLTSVILTFIFLSTISTAISVVTSVISAFTFPPKCMVNLLRHLLWHLSDQSFFLCSECMVIWIEICLTSVILTFIFLSTISTAISVVTSVISAFTFPPKWMVNLLWHLSCQSCDFSPSNVW